MIYVLSIYWTGALVAMVWVTIVRRKALPGLFEKHWGVKPTAAMQVATVVGTGLMWFIYPFAALVLKDEGAGR